jgi:hypothetical protein
LLDNREVTGNFAGCSGALDDAALDALAAGTAGG